MARENQSIHSGSSTYTGGWPVERFKEDFGFEVPVGDFQVLTIRKVPGNPNSLVLELLDCFSRSDRGPAASAEITTVVTKSTVIKCPNVAVVLVEEGIIFQAGDI